MPETNEVRDAIREVELRVGALRQSLAAEEKAARRAEIEARMASPDFWSGQEAARRDVEELRAVKAILDPLLAVTKKADDCRELFELVAADNDAGGLAEVALDVGKLREDLASLELLALLSRPHDREPCFFSIHTGAGGADACEWAEMLLRMYLRFFERRGWTAQELDFLAGEEAGIRGVELRIGGAFACGYLRGEVGVHRLVRISPFSGKRETSFAAVDVVPDYQEEINIVIDDNDLKIDTYRAGGKGGQHVNKTDSAVRITHLPTGLVVAVQNERSQHSNKETALKILKSRLKRREEEARAAQVSARNAGKMDNAWGSQIRNYVMNPYQMVKDVRTGVETGDIGKVLDGNLDNFIDAYLRWAVKQQPL
ncbi:MAG: peptide chain release factor 2 [Planctomycetota bacterium]|jgi:peptide chain release factor 2|nr:peptide chain release factor 2 [Planctomycetota bacterium]